MIMISCCFTGRCFCARVDLEGRQLTWDLLKTERDYANSNSQVPMRLIAIY